MQNAFTTLADTTWSLTQFLDAAVSYGYDGIDLRGIQDQLDITRARPFQSDELDATLAEFRRRKLQISGLSTSARCSLEAAQRQDHLDEVTRYCDLAAAIARFAGVGRPLIRVFGGRIPEGLDFDIAVKQAAEQLRRYGDIAHERGVTIGVETHDDWCDSRRMARLMEAASHPSASVVWDVHHPWRVTGEQPAQTWTNIGLYVRYVHLKDAKGSPGGPQQLCLTGEGNVPVKEALEVLRARKYDGWLALEWEKRWHPELPGADEALPAHIQYVRRFL